MSRKTTSSGLNKYLEDNINQIDDIRKEVEEIQLGFQNAYVEWITKHDAKLIQLTDLLISRWADLGTPLQAEIETERDKEKRRISERREMLRDVIIPKFQTELDEGLAKGQAKTDELRQLNPQLNQKEENLKASLVEYQTQLETLNQRIGQRSRGLGGIFHFGEISELDRQRQRLIGRMQELQKSLSDVRGEWETLHKVALSEQDDLQAHWQQAMTGLADRQAELNFLDEPGNREKLALERSTRNLLDRLKVPIECPAPDIRTELDQMIEYNIQTDDYQQGLAAVGGLIGMLSSIQEGMRRFITSIESLREQEQMHSAHLKPLEFYIPDEALTFSNTWPWLKERVQDEKYVSAHPAEFYRAIQPTLETGLSVERLSTVFDSLGKSLKNATAKWG
jgi:predicted  nucleic acid-binding Zn-ribbon protein